MISSWSVEFDTVLVIESLGAQGGGPAATSEPLYTGRKLFESTLRPAVERHGIVAEYHEASTRGRLFNALSAALALAKNGRAPILQIEAHGDRLGLTLPSGELANWREIAPVLTEINRACKMNLLVVAAACKGWHLTSVLRPIDRAPCWGVLGPPDDVKAGELFEAMSAFYQLLFSRLDLSAALGAMNGYRGASDWKFKLVTADAMFCWVFRAYVAGPKTGETQAERVNRLVAEQAVQQQLDVSQTMLLRAEMTDRLDDHRYWYDKYRRTFLMLDLFPENEARFPLSYDKCLLVTNGPSK